MRSVTPRDGDDPDAILSRVDAAVAENRRNDALAEIETLPEVVRAELSDWVAAVEARTQALAAIQSIDQSLSE